MNSRERVSAPRSPPFMKLRVHSASNVGLVREQNEDSLLVDEARCVYAVADGLGGLPGGEVASQAAIATLREELARVSGAKSLDLAPLIEAAHDAVQSAGRPFGPQGIGTTLTLVHLTEGRAEIGHVGDSFALLVRNGQCRPLTREHNIENERGDLTDLAPFPPNYRYALTRVVGTPEPVRPDFFEERLTAGDRLLLATDGLTDMVELSAIAAIVGGHPEPKACTGALIAAALEGGGRDNITVIVISVDEA